MPFPIGSAYSLSLPFFKELPEDPNPFSSPCLSFSTSFERDSSHAPFFQAKNSCSLLVAKSYFCFVAIASFNSPTDSLASIFTENALPLTPTTAQ
ncbi:hypothetical protein PsorP6_014138 [Peronosclerospora sorghi]|uniref:Uncharacterized protein n=1 Tax=Peronosclerospora sorghi TaxID=230839 RepID=A0ACC0VJQ8_9STRA|nr:hypothetical protein PsorP6_014138 [Peronosclerospora sorghi]